ncbi:MULTISPECIES: hypothetical protein [Metabacillus]|uniref:Uncharacterized protein n=2 Tax=Metabacillus TaxID=2675233 RepID=A0A179T3H8_9BACI|nr:MULTISPECIES: hypothetical protein [Metabacillus]OAS87093.1 hypothetical protein A6K24_20550 [Metabacillus litoralis]QNF26841.1 hypothetical protein HUW50_04360 [Metabacillus sp. KUDC1714]
MDDKLFEQRMQKLKKSYEHIPTISSSERILQQLKEQEKPVKKRMLLQFPYVASFIGVLLIGGFLAIQLLSQINLNSGEQTPTENRENQPITEADIETAINETRGYYERRVDELIDKLGFEDVEQYGFVQEAKIVVEKFEERKSYESQAELTNYMERVKEIITSRVSMPHEEYKLMKKAVDNGEAISDSQLYGYIDKLDMLHEQFYEQWIKMYQSNQYTMTDIESYLEELNTGNIKNGNQDYIELTKTLTAYGYYFFNDGEGTINFAPNYLKIHNQLEKSLKEDAKVYLKIKSEKKALSDGALAINHDELGERLLEIEDFVLNNPSSPKVDEFKVQYRLYIDFYLKGTNNTLLVSDNGKIKDEVKINFETLITENEYSETAKIVKGFYNKLKENQFTLTNELREQEIEVSKMLKPNPEEYAIEKNLLPITKEMAAKYEDFKNKGDMTIFNDGFAGLNSIDLTVARIYMYAIEKGDFETAYRLSYNGANSKLPEKEAFIKEMQKSPINYQALSNEVIKVRSIYEQNGEDIEHILIKENEDTVSFRMKQENGFPKVEYNPLS